MKGKKERSCPGKGSSNVRSKREPRRPELNTRIESIQLLFEFADYKREKGVCHD
jgi:hypothetical protein